MLLGIVSVPVQFPLCLHFVGRFCGCRRKSSWVVGDNRTDLRTDPVLPADIPTNRQPYSSHAPSKKKKLNQSLQSLLSAQQICSVPLPCNPPPLMCNFKRPYERFESEGTILSTRSSAEIVNTGEMDRILGAMWSDDQTHD
jgi:hypothetical protein